MPTSGHRHRLLLYTYVLNRWWRLVLGIGIILLVLAIGLDSLPRLLPHAHFLEVPFQELWAVGGIGAVAIFLSLYLIAFRKSAYVQPFSDHLRLVTPFLRFNISYRRIRQASSSEMLHLFPLGKARGWRRSFLRPIANRMAIVLDLDGYPLSRMSLRLFLSPFFFPDRTARIALLVPDWMALSTEMESLRSAWKETARTPFGESTFPNESSESRP